MAVATHRLIEQISAHQAVLKRDAVPAVCREAHDRCILQCTVLFALLRSSDIVATLSRRITVVLSLVQCYVRCSGSMFNCDCRRVRIGHYVTACLML